MLRNLLVLLHRWAGLITAAFLFFSGVTGAVISWDHELDELLNPHLTQAKTVGTPRDALSLAAEIEARYPQAQVGFIPLSAEPGHAWAFGVQPRVDPATGKLYELGFNQVFVDPVSGAELGKRDWGAVWPITRENLVSFLYVLHFSLHLPEIGGTDRWGIWLLGVIALIWTLDCFIGFALTLPSRRTARAAGVAGAASASFATAPSWWQRWVPAWKVRRNAGAYRLNFDLHRAFSLWTWGLLFIVAFTAFSLNLYRELFFPAMSVVSQVTPSPFDVRTPIEAEKATAPQVNFAEVLTHARAEAQQRGWPQPAGSVFYSPEFALYGVDFFYPEDDHGSGGVGHARLFVDSADGRILGERLPWKGTAADLFVQAQFPLHSGRILGLPGRILISLMGLVVAMLSVTGVYIWWKKRKGRLHAGSRNASVRDLSSSLSSQPR